MLGIWQHIEISTLCNGLGSKTSSDHTVIIKKGNFLLFPEFYGQGVSKIKEENIVTYLCMFGQECARVSFFKNIFI